MMQLARRPVLLVLALTLVSAALFVMFAAAGWPGDPNPCLVQGDCYCEAPRPGWIRQPANTWSAGLAPFVALAIAWHAQRRHREGGPAARGNRMRSTLFYPGLYALIVAFFGIGAMFFHASLTDWGGKVDIASMYLFADFWILYNLARLLDLSLRRFSILYVAFTATMLVPRVVFSVWGIELFNVLIWGVIATELWIRFRIRLPVLGKPRRLDVDRRWIWAALACYVPALALWEFAGHADRAACDPHSLLQAHAAWHVLTQVPPVLVYLYFLRSGPAGEASGRVPRPAAR
jgi:hypothetical protein